MALIFDMDGTIIDAVPSILRSINQTLGEMGYDPVGPEDIKISGLPLRNILLSRMSKDRVEEGVTLYKEIQYSTFTQDTRVFPGVRESLEEWKSQGHKLGIFTLRSGANARQVLEAFDIIHLFDAIVGYDETSEPKPGAKHVIDASGLVGFDARDVLVVGDNTVDIISGSSAGARTVGVLWGMGSHEDLEGAGAWRLALDIYELNSIVSRWNEDNKKKII